MGFEPPDRIGGGGGRADFFRLPQLSHALIALALVRQLSRVQKPFQPRFKLLAR